MAASFIDGLVLCDARSEAGLTASVFTGLLTSIQLAHSVQILTAWGANRLVSEFGLPIRAPILQSFHLDRIKGLALKPVVDVEDIIFGSHIIASDLNLVPARFVILKDWSSRIGGHAVIHVKGGVLALFRFSTITGVLTRTIVPGSSGGAHVRLRTRREAFLIGSWVFAMTSASIMVAHIKIGEEIILDHFITHQTIWIAILVRFTRNLTIFPGVSAKASSVMLGAHLHVCEEMVLLRAVTLGTGGVMVAFQIRHTMDDMRRHLWMWFNGHRKRIWNVCCNSSPWKICCNNTRGVSNNEIFVSKQGFGSLYM
jgi:hypothetical protein